MQEQHKRYLVGAIQKDLQKKMVFIGGPRQVGKTTLALQVLNCSKEDPNYLNWDDLKDRTIIRKNELPVGHRVLILDEIHKFKRWRTLVKGFFDKMSPERTLIVTGSARLDYYRKGGDSLQGRYHYFRLHPLSLGEISENPNRSDCEGLLEFSGFPEPFFEGTKSFYERWERERNFRIVQDDVRDLEQLRDLSLLELLMDTLPSKVGSPLSIQSLREDLEVSHVTVSNWLNLLERLYFCYRLLPYGAPKIKAVKKEQKLYLWNWTSVEDPGARFENMVASHLLKFCHLREDLLGKRMELRYLRDEKAREVDFVVIENKVPLFAVEAKLSDTRCSPHFEYFLNRTKIPFFYQVTLEEKYFSPHKKIQILPFWIFDKTVLSAI